MSSASCSAVIAATDRARGGALRAGANDGREPRRPDAGAGVLDMARTLARRGALVTFITTPLNLPRLSRAAGDDAHPIRVLPLRFPCAEAGLPDGCESLDALPGLGLLNNFNAACASMLRAPLVAHIRDAAADAPPASCVVADNYTRGPAAWRGTSVCRGSRSTAYSKRSSTPSTRTAAPCAFPTFPSTLRSRGHGRRWETSRAPAARHERVRRGDHGRDRARRRRGCKQLRRARARLRQRLRGGHRQEGMVVWTIGLLFLTSSTPSPATTADAARCARWLESKTPRSVVFVSFGSLARTQLPQLVEIARGLEASGRPFIWAAKPAGDLAEFEQWLAGDGFEACVAERGLVVTGRGGRRRG
ncbi:unnamed protein product [Urochloa humidicola]